MSVALREVVGVDWLEFGADFAKGGFFSESVMCFLDLQTSKKKIFQKTILSLKFKFPANNSILREI